MRAKLQIWARDNPKIVLKAQVRSIRREENDDGLVLPRMSIKKSNKKKHKKREKEITPASKANQA